MKREQPQTCFFQCQSCCFATGRASSASTRLRLLCERREMVDVDVDVDVVDVMVVVVG